MPMRNAQCVAALPKPGFKDNFTTTVVTEAQLGVRLSYICARKFARGAEGQSRLQLVSFLRASRQD